MKFVNVKIFTIMVITTSTFIIMTACGTFEGSYAQQITQHMQQSQRGGKYVGNATSESEAQSKALNAGYKYYNYYPSTGEVFGYN